MPPTLTDPSPAFALGLLPDLLREERALVAELAASPHDPEPIEHALAQAQLHHTHYLRERSGAHQAARTLAEHNQVVADLWPKLARLRAQAETARRAQDAEKDAVAARAIRRQRAQLAVALEDTEKAANSAQAQAEAARAALAAAQERASGHRRDEAEARAALAKMQRAGPRLRVHTRLWAVRLGLAHAALRTASTPPDTATLGTWAQAVRSAAQGFEAVGEAIDRGVYLPSEAESLTGGRTPLTAEVVTAYLALGDTAAAVRAYQALCAPQPFMHQIFHVFRAMAWGVVLGPEQARLLEPLRLHRYAQGLKGALTQALFAVLERDNAAYARALPQVVAHDALMWQSSDTPALGLVSLTACALLRLGHEHGLQLRGGLGPTVPLQAGAVAVAHGVR